MVFLNQNKKRYDWDNSDIDYNAGTPPLYELPAELPGIDLETDNIDTSVVIPTIAQFYAQRVHEETTNIFLIPEGNNIQSTGVAILVDETPLGGGNPIDVPQECVSPKIQ